MSLSRRKRSVGIGLGEDEVRGGEELLVEILAETADERAAQELIDTDPLAAALLEGLLADVPMVDVQCKGSVGKLLDADGIQGAGDGLGEIATARDVAALDGTQAVAVLEKGIGALLGTGNERGDDIPLEIDLEKTLGLRRCAPRFAHQRGIGGIVALQEFGLALFQRSSAVPHDAAFTLTYLIVACEILGEDILRYEAVAYLYYRSETVPGHI